MERIKIVHIITDLDIGGAELMLLKLLRNWEDKKYEHFVVSLMPIGSVGEEIKKEGFEVYTLGVNKYNFILPFIKLLFILKKEKPQIVFNYLFHAEIFGRIAAKWTQVPIVFSFLRNESGYYDRKRNVFLRKLLRVTDRYVDAFAAVCQKVADVHRDIITKEIRVIRNGLELKNGYPKDVAYVRQDLNIKNGSFLLITIASLKPKKGHTFLFDALKALKKKGYEFKLLVVGSGREEKRLKKEIMDKGLENEVILTGERDDIPELLAASDAFVCPSLYEGLPSALLEAMEAGLPVIAIRVGGIPEAITDNETGLLIEPKDSRALTEAIVRIMKDTELRKRLGSNARDYVRKNFDIKRTVTEIRLLCEEYLIKSGKN